MVLVDSNLDERRCMKLASWKLDFEWRLVSPGFSSKEVSGEEECEISKDAVECENEKFLVSWVNAES